MKIKHTSVPMLMPVMTWVPTSLVKSRKGLQSSAESSQLRGSLFHRLKTLSFKLEEGGGEYEGVALESSVRMWFENIA